MRGFFRKKAVWILAAVLFLGTAALGVRMAKVKGKEAEGLTSADFYYYLIETQMAEGDLSEAGASLERMYASCGESGKGTLLYARDCVLKYDYVGAGVLYGKLSKISQDGLMSETDRNIYDQIQKGELADFNAAPAEEMRAFLEQDVAALRQQYPQYLEFEEAVSMLDRIEEAYRAYLADGTVDMNQADSYLVNMEKVYKSCSQAFHVREMDEAYIRLLVMTGAGAKLAEYADQTDSQLAMVSVGQLLIDRKMSADDLPKGFVNVDPDHITAVANQCEHVLTDLEKKKEGAELRSYADKVEAISSMEKNLALTEVDRRLAPDNAALPEKSPLYMGSSAVAYALGNTEKGDEYVKKSMETAPYYQEPMYSGYMSIISSAYYEAGDLSAVMDIGSSVVSAFDAAVPHAYTKPEKEEEDNRKEEDGDSIWDILLHQNMDVDAITTSMLSAANLLASQYTTCVAKENAAMSIGKIDVSKFPTISFNLTTSKPIEDLANPGLLINDCNIVIDEYTIEEKKFDSAILYAVCDKSGSMEGSTSRLQSAVRGLAGSLSKKEKMGLIGFSDGVEFDSGIVENVSDLSEYISKLEPGGGTNIASGTFAALSHLSGKEDTINVVIVMTDGEDSSFGSDNLDRLREYVDDGHTLVYTVGMGSSVNASYLQQIASAGNGKFVYSFSASELSAIYEFIHAQMENNYVVTFTAKDVEKNDRVLTCVNKADGYSVTKTYSLGREEIAEPVTEYPDFSCTGFVTKKLYKQNAAIETSIRGTGFRSDMTCFVTIEGDCYRGSFEGKFHSDKSFLVTLPAAVQPGKYKVVISIEGGTYKDEIEVLNCTEQIFTFGAYQFSCDEVERFDDRDEVILKGNVLMNGWLQFKGDVVIKGDIKGESVTLSASDSFVVTDKKPTGIFSEFTDTIFLGSWNEFPIWKDKEHMTKLDEYKVDTRRYEADIQLLCILGTGPEIQLYPHKMQFKFFDVDLNFPFMSQLFDGQLPLKFASEVGGSVDKKGLHSKGSVSVEDVNAKKKLFKLTLGIKKIAISWDTEADDYGFTFIVNTDILFWSADPDDGTSYGFEIGVKAAKLDTVRIYADTPVTVLKAPVPVSMNNFSIGVEGLGINFTGDEANKPLKTILYNAEFTGSADIGFAAVSDVCPNVKPIFGKLSLATLADTTIRFGFNRDNVMLTSKVKLLGEIDYGECDLTIGKFSVHSYVLGLTHEDVKGIYCMGKQGPDISLKRIAIKYQGATTWTITNKAALINIQGQMSGMIDVWKKYEFTNTGQWELGVYGSDDAPNFYIGMYGQLNTAAGAADKETKHRFLVGMNGWKPYYKWE